MANFSLLAKMGLDSKGFQTGIDKADSKVKRFSKSATAQLARVAGAFIGIGLVKSIISLGTAAAETASKFNAVFGPSADEMNLKVQELRKTIPSTTAEMQNALATFSQMARAFGMNADAADMFSVEMVKIAGDIASFNNLPIEDAFTKIRSAISGEFEPMKQLGIVINEARIKQEALNLKIWDGTEQMSAAEKALAVQSILIRDMGAANGDAAATADSAANKIKFLKNDLKELGTEIGTTALPAILKLTEGLAKMLELTEKVMSFVGTQVGEMIFGVSDETLSKREKAISQYEAELQAVRELTKEGKLYKQGLLEGTLWTKGLSEKLAENKRLIEERKKSILESSKAQNQELKNTIDAISEEESARKDDTGDKPGDKTGDKELIAAKELEALELRAAGKNAQAEALEKQIELMKEAIRISREYGISLEKAAELVKGIEANKPKEEDEDEARKKKLEKLEEKIKDMKLAALRAQADGDKKAEESLNNRVRIAEKIVSIMKEFGVSQEEATRLAQDKEQPKPDDTRGDFALGLEGHQLRKAANKAGKDDNIRFEKLGDGGFQQYVNGRKGEKFTEEQLQKGLENKIEKDPTDETLKSIEKLLQGKFVNE